MEKNQLRRDAPNSGTSFGSKPMYLRQKHNCQKPVINSAKELTLKQISIPHENIFYIEQQDYCDFLNRQSENLLSKFANKVLGVKAVKSSFKNKGIIYDRKI